MNIERAVRREAMTSAFWSGYQDGFQGRGKTPWADGPESAHLLKAYDNGHAVGFGCRLVADVALQKTLEADSPT